MTTAASFYADVSEAIKRGTSLDAKIPGWAASACSWLERNFDYNYMRKIARFAWEADDVIDLPVRLKRVEFVRVYVAGEDGTETYQGIQQTSARMISSTQAELQYWWMEDGLLKLDGVPAESVNLEWSYYQYSLWPADPTDSVPILSDSYNGMLWQTLMNFATFAKDLRMVELYKGMRDEALSTELRADQALQTSGQRFAMGYNPRV